MFVINGQCDFKFRADQYGELLTALFCSFDSMRTEFGLIENLDEAEAALTLAAKAWQELDPCSYSNVIRTGKYEVLVYTPSGVAITIRPHGFKICFGRDSKNLSESILMALGPIDHITVFDHDWSDLVMPC